MSILDDSTSKRNAADCGEQNIEGANGTRPNLQSQADGNGSGPQTTVAPCVSPQPRSMLDVVREARQAMINEHWRRIGRVRDDIDEDELYQSPCLRKR